MWVRILAKKVQSARGTEKEGDIVELSDADAQSLIDTGAAEKVTRAEAEAETEAEQ